MKAQISDLSSIDNKNKPSNKNNSYKNRISLEDIETNTLNNDYIEDIGILERTKNNNTRKNQNNHSNDIFENINTEALDYSSTNLSKSIGIGNYINCNDSSNLLNSNSNNAYYNLNNKNTNDDKAIIYIEPEILNVQENDDTEDFEENDYLESKDTNVNSSNNLSKIEIIIRSFIYFVLNLLLLYICFSILSKAKNYYIKSLQGCNKQFFVCLNMIEQDKGFVNEIYWGLVNSSIYFYTVLIIITHVINFNFILKHLNRCFNITDNKNLTYEGNDRFYKFYKVAIYLLFNVIIKYAFSSIIKYSNTLLKVLLYYYAFDGLISIMKKDQGVGFEVHGFYNTIIFIILSIIYFTIHLFIYIVLRLIFKLKTRVLYVFIPLMIVLLVFYIKFNSILSTSCDTWNKGFNDIQISNSKDSQCKINKPTKCFKEIFNGVFKYSYWVPESKCSLRDSSNYALMKEVITDKSAKRLGFPRTENWDYKSQAKRKEYNRLVRKGIINMDDPNIKDRIKKEIEVVVDYNKTPVKLDIKLIKKIGLANERYKKYQRLKSSENFNPNGGFLPKNVLLFYLDSLSRAEFKRKLPKFHSWMEQFYWRNNHTSNYKVGDEDTKINNNNDRINNTNKDFFNIPEYRNNTDLDQVKRKIESYQFLKYHGVGRYTVMNNLPLFWGNYVNQQVSKNFFYLKDAVDSGYITGTAQNHCARETVASDDVNNLPFTNYDHELNGLFCDPNNESKDNEYSSIKGSNNMLPRCLYNQHTAKISMDYTLQFFRAYREVAKYFHLGIMDNHEVFGEGVAILDDMIVEFFENFRKEGFLENTTVIVLSDHGHAFFGLWSVLQANDHIKELVLPSLFLILPKEEYGTDYEKIKSNLIFNENSLVTPFTMHNTFQALFSRSEFRVCSYSKYNIFYNKIPLDTNCQSFYSSSYFRMSEYLCRCDK